MGQIEMPQCEALGHKDQTLKTRSNFSLFIPAKPFFRNIRCRFVEAIKNSLIYRVQNQGIIFQANLTKLLEILVGIFISNLNLIKSKLLNHTSSAQSPIDTI